MKLSDLIVQQRAAVATMQRQIEISSSTTATNGPVLNVHLSFRAPVETEGNEFAT